MSNEPTDFIAVLRGPAHLINVDALRQRNAERVAAAIANLRVKGLYGPERGEPIVKRKK